MAKLTRRELLRGTALTGAGLFMAGQGLPVFAQDAKPDAALPQGASGKLTVIHRTEYFEAAQTAFRDTVQAFADCQGCPARHLDHEPRVVRRLHGQDDRRREGRQSARLRLYQQRLDLAAAPARPRRGRERRGRRGGEALRRHHAGPQRRQDRAARRQVVGDPADRHHHRLLRPRRQAQGKGHRSCIAQDDRRSSRGGAGDFRSRLLRLGLHPQPVRRRLRLPDQRRAGLRRSLHRRDRPDRAVQLARDRAAFEFLRETYDRNGKYAAMLPPGIESWNDTGNNEAYLAGQIGFTQNAFSIYAQAKRDNNPVYPNTLLLPAPQAINGDSRDGGNVGGWMTIFKNAPNVALAKELALDLLDPANFGKISALGGVLFTPAYHEPVDAGADGDRPEPRRSSRSRSASPIRSSASPGRRTRTRGVDAIRAQGVLEQSVGNVISGRMAPADAVKDAHQKMVRSVRRRRDHAAVRQLLADGGRRRRPPTSRAGRGCHLVTPARAQLLHPALPGASAGRRLDHGQAHHPRYARWRHHYCRASAVQAQEHLRPRLEDRLPVRAAHGSAHGRPDLLAVHQRHPDVDDDLQLPDRRDE